MKNIIEFLDSNPVWIKVIWSVVIIIVVIVIARIIKKVVYKKIKDNKRYYAVKRRINYIAGFLMVISIILIWIEFAGNITTYIGLVSAGIAIALKEVFANIAGWIFIEIRRPFDVGHRILIGSQKGDVIDKRVFQFSLMEVSSYEDGEQSTGRIIDVPNSFVFYHPTINYTKGFEYIWNEIKVLLTFDSDWEKAKDLLLEIANKDTDITTEKVSKQIRKASQKYMIHYSKLTPIVYTDIKDSGIQLTIRYLCEPKQRRITSNKILEDVLVLVEKHDTINLAYPTKRVVNS